MIRVVTENGIVLLGFKMMKDASGNLILPVAQNRTPSMFCCAVPAVVLKQLTNSLSCFEVALMVLKTNTNLETDANISTDTKLITASMLIECHGI